MTSKNKDARTAQIEKYKAQLEKKKAELEKGGLKADEINKDKTVKHLKAEIRRTRNAIAFIEKKQIKVDALRNARLMPVDKRPTWNECTDMFGASPSTLIKALKDAGYWDYDKRTVI